MPLYHFKCTSCDWSGRRLIESTEVAKQTCSECSRPVKREPRPPSTHVIETLDNGHMVKKVERFADAEHLFRERAKNDPRKKP